MGKWALAVLLVFLIGAAPPFAESYAQTKDGTARAGSGDIVIWYRASQACPSGAEFVSSIRVEGRPTRLARAGDHIEYVITLESEGNVSSGRLERQTERGTIAISELRGGSCSEVAEALALSLMLAVTPKAETAETAPPVVPPPAPRSAVSEQPTSAVSARAPTGAGVVVPAKRTAAVPGRARSRLPVVPRWWLGGGLEGALGMTPDSSLGANLFVEYDFDLVSPQRPASIRLGPGIMYSRTPIEDLQVDQWVTSLGLEVCPLTLFGGAFGLAPCVVGEGGSFVASTNRETSLTSVNFWGAAGPALRGRAQLSPKLQLGLSAAVTVPFSRQELIAGGDLLYRTPPAVFSLGIDLSWGIP